MTDSLRKKAEEIFSISLKMTLSDDGTISRIEKALKEVREEALREAAELSLKTFNENDAGIFTIAIVHKEILALIDRERV